MRCQRLVLGVLSLFSLAISRAATPEEVGTEDVAPVTLYEQRLLNAIEEMNALDAYAEDTSNNFSEIERRFRQVSNTFNGVIASNPDMIEARLIYGKMLDRYGDRHGAGVQFREVLSRDPSVAVAHQQLGTYYAEERDLPRALAYYLSAIDYAPNEPVYHFGLGNLLHAFQTDFVEEGLLEEAVLREKMLEAFAKAAELAPRNPVYHFRYGEAFDQLVSPDWEAALAHWNAFAAWPQLTPLQRQLISLHAVRCLGELERYDEALERLAKVDLPDLASDRTALEEAIAEARSRS